MMMSSLLYKDPDKVTISVNIERKGNKIELLFSSDCGKHGTDELLDGYSLTPARLLEILQHDCFTYTEEELEI